MLLIVENKSKAAKGRISLHSEKEISAECPLSSVSSILERKFNVFFVCISSFKQRIVGLCILKNTNADLLGLPVFINGNRYDFLLLYFFLRH
jgi:hypothetical protein